MARTIPALLSPHLDSGQSRSPGSERGDDDDLASGAGKADRLFRRFRRFSARTPGKCPAARSGGPTAGRAARAAASLCRPLSRQSVKGAPGAEPAKGAGPPRTRRARRARAAAAHRLSRPAAVEPAADHPRSCERRLRAGQAGAVAPRPAARPGRPSRAARRPTATARRRSPGCSPDASRRCQDR